MVPNGAVYFWEFGEGIRNQILVFFFLNDIFFWFFMILIYELEQRFFDFMKIYEKLWFFMAIFMIF